MSIDLIISPDRVNNPFEAARRQLLKDIAAMRVPAPYGTWPEAEDHEEVRDHIRAGADIFDRWLKAIGDEVASNSVTNLKMSLFDGAFSGAIDGYATFECDRAAEAAREDAVEYASEYAQ